MKKLFLLTFLLPVFASAQTLTASTEPSMLYNQINASLSNDDTKQALHGFAEVVEFYEAQGREKELPESYFGMALVLALNGHYHESIKYHKKAIRLHRKYRDDEPLEMYINLALTYELAGKNRKAKRILEAKTGHS